MIDEAARFTAEHTAMDANLEVRELKHLLVVAEDKITKLEAENAELKKTIKPKVDWESTPDVSRSEGKPRWFPPRSQKEEKDNPFARNEAYIEHRKEFPYYPDKPKEDEGTRKGRETAEYLKSLGYMGGKKDKEEKSLRQKAVEASNRRSEIPTMDWQDAPLRSVSSEKYAEPEDKSQLNADDEEPNYNSY